LIELAIFSATVHPSQVDSLRISRLNKQMLNSPKSSKRLFWVCSVFLLLAILSLWPAPLHLLSAVPDYPDFLNISPIPHNSDSLVFCWNLWWINGWIHGQHPLFFTNLLHHPYGTTLSGHTLSLASGFLGFFVISILGAPGTLNCLLIFHAFLTGFAFYLLLTELQVLHRWAIIFGSALVFFPPRIMHSLGHLNLAGLGWMILFLWLIVKASQSSRFLTLPSLLWLY
jgi:hypothetical protein